MICLVKYAITESVQPGIHVTSHHARGGSTYKHVVLQLGN